MGNVYQRGGENEWFVKDCLSVWWRPNFDTFLASLQLHTNLYDTDNAVPLPSAAYHRAQGDQETLHGRASVSQLVGNDQYEGD